MISLFKKIYKMAAKFRTQINISIILQFFDGMFALVPLATVMMFFQNYTNGTLSDSFHLQALGMLVIGVLARILVRYNIDKKQYSTLYTIMADERIKIADHLKKINMGFFSDDNVGRVTTILTNGISFIEEQGMVGAVNCLTSFITILVIFFMLMSLSPMVALIYAAFVLVIFLVLYFYHKKTIAYADDYNKATEDTSSAVIEYVRNISVIKAFNLIGKHKRSKKAFIHHRKVDLAGELINIPYLIGAMLLMAVGTGTMLWYIIGQYQSESMELYTVVTLSILSLYVFNSVTVIAMKVALSNIANDGLMSIDKLYDEKAMPINADKKPESYDVEFSNVSFAYENEDVIKNISFTLKQNTMTALVGLSGSGKSTLVNLIPRFFDVERGEIKIGGVNVKDMTDETLYSMISMVFQNVYLFKDTIYNNIVFGNENASEEDVMIACKKARCFDFINALPEGLQTQVGEAGLSLSGGERQRISIARAMLKDAPIILLDEATASVDPDNESEIQDAINALVKDKTILVIAHKLSCVKNADNILMLRDGTVAESGTHEELLSANGLYYSLWQKRVSSKSWKIKKN